MAFDREERAASPPKADVGKRLQDLYLVGLGIDCRAHLTREGEKALKQARVILHIDEDHRWLRKLNPSVVDLKKMYWSGDERLAVYERIRARIITEMEGGPGVAFATYGHPMIFDRIANGLISHCRQNGRSVRVVNGISSLDTLATDLGIEYGQGLQLYDATHVVTQAQPLNPRAHALLLQIGEFGCSRTSNVIDRAAPRRYLPLIDHLKKFYPPSHRVTIAFSDNGEGLDLHPVPLSALDRHRQKIVPGATLYIPPLPA